MARLTEQRLLKAAGESSFGRGEGYVRWVAGLRVVDETAAASVHGQRVYVVNLDWAKPGLRGDCTCPHFDDGNFCKHLVALGLAVIDQQGEGQQESPDIAGHLAHLEIDELRDLLGSLATSDPDVRRAIEIRVAAKTGDVETISAKLVSMVTSALTTRGYVDYRSSFSVAADAEWVLDELESQLDVGSADAVRPALLKAVTRLQKIVLHSDDSSGLMGSACQRAADLYARSCREGRPDGKKLATWLVRFRDESPGWPELVLADVVDAFDDVALAAYRRGVDKLNAKYVGKDNYERHEIDTMLLELADHDGDIDRAVEILSPHGQVQYGAIVERLREAGRMDEAVSWIDRGVAEGRLDVHGRANSFWLGYDDVAHTYRSLGRVDDAFAVLRDNFTKKPGLATYRTLLDHAVEESRWETERAWALECAAELAGDQFGSGAALIEIALGEGDLDAAWAAATTYGAGHKWKALASASTDARPVDAAELYRPGVEKDLVHTDSKMYPDIAKRLTIMRDLYARAGRADEFAEYVAELRERYKRRPSFMSVLDRQRL